jgi:hypothetical protein
VFIAYAVSYAVTYIATGSAKAAQGAGLSAALFMGIGGLRGGKMGTNGKMQHNPGWESGSMKTLAAHGLAGGIMQDRMGGSFGAGFLSGSLGGGFGTACCDVGNCITHSVSNNHLNKDTCKIYRNGFGNYCRYKSRGKMSIWPKPPKAQGWALLYLWVSED